MRSQWIRRHFRSHPYQGWLAGPTVNSLMVVSSGWSIANATTLASQLPFRQWRASHKTSSMSWEK
jgi:hypothetical protein